MEEKKNEEVVEDIKGESQEKAEFKKVEKPKKDKTVKIKESEKLKLEETAAEYKDKYIRLFAEFDNARKRMDREKMDFVKYANEELIIEFLNVVDDLNRSVQVANEKHQDYEGFLKGIEMIMGRINDLLTKNGVKPVETKDKMFDPHCHEVLLQEENNDVDEGQILEEYQTGYFLNNRVVRTSKVKVAKASGDIEK